MCGFAGAFDPGTEAAAWPGVLEGMAAALAHRGPDDQGLWHDREAGLGLAFRRLSILDLSVEGHQPMTSPSGRYVMAYNGEVYNYDALRTELLAAGVRFRGHSDTEAMLAGFEQWGLLPAISRFVGMFAFALWDKTERRLHLVRDRIGIKPLYWGWSRGALLFGSEMTSLRRHPSFAAGLDRNAVASFLQFNYVPAPHAIFEGFRKLEPGCVRTFELGTGSRLGGEGRLDRYWSLGEVASAGLARPFSGDEREAIDELDLRLKDSVALRMIADVPLGAFLSGGIDSSLVVALMQAQSTGKVRTFTIGFAEKQYDESAAAAAVAARLGTDHTERIVSAGEALEAVPRIAKLFDEPFADSSQVPTLFVSELARANVTVSLSGDGGDELFAGYKRYALFQDLQRSLGLLPAPARKAFAAMLNKVPVGAANGLLSLADPWLRRYGSGGAAGDKLRKLAELLALPGDQALYVHLLSHWKNPESLVPGAVVPPRLADEAARPAFTDALHPLMFDDMLAYLPDDILVKVDRTSMSVGLEARVPILDHRVVEFAWRLPLSMKLKDGGTKWALRQVLYRYLPPALVDRPKMGFGLPIDVWLRGSLKSWAGDLLSEPRLRRDGLLEPGPILEKWREHLSGRRNWQYYLWDVLMLQSWRETHAV